MSDENTNWVGYGTQASTSSTWDDFVLDFGNSWEDSNMSAWDTKTWVTDDNVSTDEVEERGNTSSQEWNIEQTEANNKDDNWELELSFEDFENDPNSSREYNWDNEEPQDEIQFENKDTPIDNSEDSSLKDESVNMPEDDLLVDNNKDQENDTENINDFLQGDDLFDQAENSNPVDNQETPDNLDSKDINKNSNINDVEFEDEKPVDLNNIEDVDSNVNDKYASEVVDDGDTNHFMEWSNSSDIELDNVNELNSIEDTDNPNESYQDNKPYNDSDNHPDDQLFDNENVLQNEDSGNLSDDIHSDKIELEHEWVEYQQNHDENSMDFSQSINEDNLPWNNIDENFSDEDNSKKDEFDNSNYITLDLDLNDKEDNIVETEIWKELNEEQQESKTDEKYFSEWEINDTYENNDQWVREVTSYINDNNVVMDNNTVDTLNTVNEWEQFHNNEWSNDLVQENANIYTNSQSNMEYTQDFETKISNEESKIQDNQNIQTQYSNNDTTNYTNGSLDANMSYWNIENQAKELPQFNVFDEKEKWSNNNIEMKSTLSLDQILDSEISSNPGLMNGSEAIPQNKSNTWWNSGNKKMVTTLVWIGAFVIVWVLAFMAFPTLMWEKEPWVIEDVWWTVGSWEEYTWEEYEEHSSAYSWDTESEEIGLGNDGSSESSSSVIEFPDAYTEEWEEWGEGEEEEEPEPYQQEEFIEEYEETSEDMVDDIAGTISSFKSQAEMYYSVWQEIYDRQMVKYSLRLINLCDNYQQQIDAGEWIDKESFSSFEASANKIIKDIEDYNNWWEETEVIQSNLDDSSYFEGKDDLKDYIYNR